MAIRSRSAPPTFLPAESPSRRPPAARPSRRAGITNHLQGDLEIHPLSGGRISGARRSRAGESKQPLYRTGTARANALAVPSFASPALPLCACYARADSRRPWLGHRTMPPDSAGIISWADVSSCAPECPLDSALGAVSDRCGNSFTRPSLAQEVRMPSFRLCRYIHQGASLIHRLVKVSAAEVVIHPTNRRRSTSWGKSGDDGPQRQRCPGGSGLLLG
jgi:hypothetical protein